MKEEERVIYINKDELGAKVDAVKIYGDIQILADTEKLRYNRKILEPHQLRYRLRDTGYWETEHFILKKTAIIKSQRSK